MDYGSQNALTVIGEASDFKDHLGRRFYHFE